MNLSTAELYDCLIGLYNYDMGDTNNGINNPYVKTLVQDDLNAMSEYNFRIIMSRFLREYFVSENSLFVENKGIADASSFIDWLNTSLGIDV